MIKASYTQLVGLTDFSPVFHNACALISALMDLDIFYDNLHKYSSCSCSVHAVLHSSRLEKGRHSCLMQHLSQKTWNSISMRYTEVYFCCWVWGIFCFFMIGMTASDFLFSKDFLNFLQENSEGFLSKVHPRVKYHSILADFCGSRSTYCCSPFITPFFWAVTLKGSASAQGGEHAQDIQKHVSVGRVEGTGRNPFTSRLGLRKVLVNLSLPCTGFVGPVWS